MEGRILKRAREHKAAAAGVVLTVLALSSSVSADGAGVVEEGAEADDAAVPLTFAYEAPSEARAYELSLEKNYIRAVLELEMMFGVGFMYYVTSAGRDWDLGYRWRAFKPKITFETFGPDKNHLGTNYVGHPLGGASYYHAARSNRLSVFEAYAYAFAGSLVWEYFGEITELVSMNDMIVTPVAGVAIGESTIQLGAFFDRSAPTTTHKILGSTFAPFKSFNDWVDGLKPKRSTTLYPTNEWHRFELAAGLAVLHRLPGSVSGGTLGAVPELDVGSSDTTAGFAFRAFEHLARLPDYDGAGEHGFGFYDGNRTSIELDGIVADEGLVDLRIAARMLLAGYYFRDAIDTNLGLSGSGGVVGLGTTFEFAAHDYRRVGAGVDKIASVQPLTLYFEHNAASGRLRLDSYVEVGPGLSGLAAHALEAYTGPLTVLPDVLQDHHYYFGLGGLGRTGLRLRWQRFEFDVGLRGESYSVIKDRPSDPDISLSDQRLLGRGGIAVQLVPDGAWLRLQAQHDVRRGRLENASAETQESGWFGFVGGIF